MLGEKQACLLERSAISGGQVSIKGGQEWLSSEGGHFLTYATTYLEQGPYLLQIRVCLNCDQNSVRDLDETPVVQAIFREHFDTLE